jgi:hypothetical protein
MNSKLKTDKQGEYDYIDEKKLKVYKLQLNVSPRRLLWAPYIGGCRRGETTYAMGWLKWGRTRCWRIRERGTS